MTGLPTGHDWWLACHVATPDPDGDVTMTAVTADPAARLLYDACHEAWLAGKGLSRIDLANLAVTTARDVREVLA